MAKRPEEIKEENKPKGNGLLKLLQDQAEQSRLVRENLTKLQTQPPNVIKLVDCCLSCKERYMDDGDMSMENVFCTKHKMWIAQCSKCDDFGRIKAGKEHGEGTEEAHNVIRELIEKKAW